MNILVIGGTRNLGHFLVHDLVAAGHRVTVFNRGRTRDELPASVERLHGDRTDTRALAAAVRGRTFDVVFDNALYKGDEAEAAVEVFNGGIGHYLVLSTGQVYLVREGIERPFRERDYAGRVMPSPKPNTYVYEEWLYGIDKRRVEDVLTAAHAAHGFPYTALRIPMVNSERDHFGRLYAYVLRLKDGGPILVPSTPNFALRHVYGKDVVRAQIHLATHGLGKGAAINLSQDETFTLEAFIALLAEVQGMRDFDPAARIVRVPRALLEANGFLPDCSPFSERWMSELDNTLSKSEYGISYTPAREYLAAITAYYQEETPPPTAGYRRRRAERRLYESIRDGAVPAAAPAAAPNVE